MIVTSNVHTSVPNTQISIDSTKIRIPLQCVEVLDYRLGETRREIDSNSEVLREWKNNKLSIKENGISTYYGIETQVDKQRMKTEYLVILFNSKLLKSSYLNGITENNIKGVYDALINQGVVYVSQEDFESGELTDTDFKSDYLVKSMRATFSVMNQNAKAHKQMNRGCYLFNEIKNQGIEFGKRERASVAFPYLKLYAKYLELYGNEESDSFLFANTYGIKLPKHTVRLEFTLKNRKHWKRYGIEDTSLNSLIRLNQSKLKAIQSEIVSSHMEPRTPKITKRMNNTLTPDNNIKCNLMALALGRGFSIEQILLVSVDQIEDKSARSKKRKQLLELYELHIKDTKESKLSHDLNSFFDSIGYG